MTMRYVQRTIDIVGIIRGLRIIRDYEKRVPCLTNGIDAVAEYRLRYPMLVELHLPSCT